MKNNEHELISDEINIGKINLDSKKIGILLKEKKVNYKTLEDVLKIKRATIHKTIFVAKECNYEFWILLSEFLQVEKEAIEKVDLETKIDSILSYLQELYKPMIEQTKANYNTISVLSQMVGNSNLGKYKDFSNIPFEFYSNTKIAMHYDA